MRCKSSPLSAALTRDFMVFSALAVLKFFVPSHLNGFKLGFIGLGGVPGEAVKFRDPFVHVCKANGQGIGVRKFVGQCNGNVFKIVPVECVRHMPFSVLMLLLKTGY